MRNIDLLLKSNKISKKKITFKDGAVQIRISGGLFTGSTLKSIIESVNEVHCLYKGMKIPIEFHFGRTEFIDKLTFVLFECLCYDLIHNYGHYVQVFMEVDIEGDIHTAGIMSSPLLLLNGTKKEKVMKYQDRFKMDLYGKHFRRLINGNEKENTNYLGRLYEEIDSFLKPFGIEEESRDKIGIVISELVGNACEHGVSDCLVDIDVAPNYTKVVKNVPDGNDYCGINIAVVNFSGILLGSGVFENVIQNADKLKSDRYSSVILAYRNHSKMFSQDYTIEDFCNITTFQHKISGRGENSITGGTGLTKLIQSLEQRSDAYRCYVVSGNRSVNFYKELIEYNDDKWIGFNENKDYISNIPSQTDDRHAVISESLMFMPGTGYNLNFVMKGE